MDKVKRGQIVLMSHSMDIILQYPHLTSTKPSDDSEMPATCNIADSSEKGRVLILLSNLLDIKSKTTSKGES